MGPIHGDWITLAHVQGTLETPNLKSRVGKPDEREGILSSVAGAQWRTVQCTYQSHSPPSQYLPVPRRKLTKRVDDILEGDTCQKGGKRAQHSSQPYSGCRGRVVIVAVVVGIGVMVVVVRDEYSMSASAKVRLGPAPT